MEPSDQTGPDQSAMLLQAFQSFSEASLLLERSYAELSEHTAKLDLELRNSNERLRETLREQENTSLHLRSILNSLKTGILVIDLEGIVQECNPAAAKLLGIAVEKIHYGKLLLPEPVRDFIFCCIESTMPRIPRKEVSIERNGDSIDLELQFALVRPEGGGILSVLILINDNTQLNRLQSQSKRNARLTAMGEMAAELAHEIRNPLGSIKLFAGLLEQDVAEMPASRQLAEQVSSGIQILENIVSNILAFSANVQPKNASLDVAKLLRECAPLFEMDLKRKEIELAFDLPERRLQIQGDEHLLKQMLLNLSMNAIRAMESGGTLTLSARAREDYAEIRIIDTGCGIPAAVLPKIFDPFFTTFQGGTGLGLSVVNQIVEKHGGALDIKSTVGEGTQVIVSLPRYFE